MRLPLVVIVPSVQCAFAQTKSDSLAVQTPDSLETSSANQLHRLLMEKARVEPDGVVIGNTKFFILIAGTDPSINPGMIFKIPDNLDIDRMPVPTFKVPGRPQSLGPNIDRMPTPPFNVPGSPPDSTRRFRYR